MTTLHGIIDSIDNRLRELTEEITALTQARAALGGENPPPRKRSTSKPTAAAPESNGVTEGRGAAGRPRTRIIKTQDTVSRPATGSAQRSRKPTSGRRERLEAQLNARIEQVLSDNGEMTTSAIAELLNESRVRTLPTLRALERTGRVHRTGQRRATRWRRVTDEERVEKRAAELAARSRRAA